MSNEPLTEDKRIELLQQLPDGPFKKFYLENPKEQKFLFSKVGAEELSVFSESEFSLADVLKCRYVATYLKKRNRRKDTFKKALINHIKKFTGETNIDIEKKIKKHVIRFIEECYADEAMEGLKMYVENGEKFPHAKESDKLKQKNMAHYCPEKSFVDKCLVREENSFESTEIVKKAYENYCESNDITQLGNLKNYIVDHMKIKVMKKRIDDNGNLLSEGNPRATYEGLRLKDKYRR